MRMGNMGKFWILGIVFEITQIVVSGETKFELPDGTPGVRLPNLPCSKDSHEMRMCISVPGTKCVLSFPQKGFQPTTCDAGKWSGARYVGQLNDDAVTDWWIRIFGGDLAVCMANNREISTTEMTKICPIIQMATQKNYAELGQPITIENLMAFEQQFWKTFRIIASDPVGRVLLYRLLIEIRRSDGVTPIGCCETGIDSDDDNVVSRKNSRSLTIYYESKRGCAYLIDHINVNQKNIQPLVLTKTDIGKCVTTKGGERDLDIGLFHEMIHWFRYLRNPLRVREAEMRHPKSFKYAMRCYYGDQTELSIWDCNINSEDIATVLGSPNYNKQKHLDLIPSGAFLSSYCLWLDEERIAANAISIIAHDTKQYIPFNERYLNGDDLCENAYRLSRSQKQPGPKFYMRFGHTQESINPFPLYNLPMRFKLAHQVAWDCYQEITGNSPRGWDLRSGEAIQ